MNPIDNHVWQVRYRVRKQVLNQVYDQVFSQVKNQVLNRVYIESINNLRKSINHDQH